MDRVKFWKFLSVQFRGEEICFLGSYIFQVNNNNVRLRSGDSDNIQAMYWKVLVGNNIYIGCNWDIKKVERLVNRIKLINR